MWIVVVTVGVCMGCTLPAYEEVVLEKSATPASFGERLQQMFTLLCQPAVWRLVFALVSTTAVSLVSNQAQTNANAQWFHITPLQLGLSACMQSLMLALGTRVYKRYLLQKSWRVTFGTALVGMQLLNLLYLLTIYTDAFKNGWWYIFTQACGL